jgi:hypothetical protein
MNGRMPIAVAEDARTADSIEPGAPFPRDTIDPELVKLGRGRPRIGIATSAGIVFLCVFFLFKLNPDRRFASEPEQPARVTVAGIADGKVGEDRHVVVDAEPLMSHAIRVATARGNIGMRVVPARGSNEKLWLVIPGDGWADANTLGYAGRLRALEELPFSDSVAAFLRENPRPLFAPAAAVRAGFATNKVTTVTRDEILVRDGDRVGFDVIDPGSAVIVCTFNERHPDVTTCAKAVDEAGIEIAGSPEERREHVRLPVTTAAAVATTTTKLEAAQQWGMQVEPVTQHHETTWGALKTSPAGSFTIDKAAVPEAQLDLIGLYVSKHMPRGAYALITGERPQDYWYVVPVTVLVGLIALLFLWALVRGIKRDLLAARA